MILLPLGELESAKLVYGDPELAVTSLVCDSRLACPGSLFACLRGVHVDGHDFIDQAARRGATAALCGRGRAPRAGRLATLECDDPLATLAEVARLVRRRSRAHVIGVAGSAGKTTLKDALRALLAPRLSTIASAASYNNELGVPLTLAQLEPDTAVCVRAIAVLGPMSELGPESARWHVLAGRQADDLGVDLLVAIGDGARPYLDGAAGRTACLWFPDNGPAVSALRSLLRRGGVVLLKGSRTAHLEVAGSGARSIKARQCQNAGDVM